MGWTDYGWEDDPSTATPLDAEKLEDFGEHVHNAAAATAATAAATALTAHTADTSAAHGASAISFSPGGTIAATDVQAAVAEVATDAASALASELAVKADLSGGHVPLAQLGSGTPASGKYVDGASGAWLPIPAQSGSGAILAWATGTVYAQGQTVTNSGHTYTANDAHTAGATFAGDLASHWTLLPLTAADVGAQPVDSDLTAIAALTTTSYGRAFLALADATAARTALSLGTAATQATGAFDAAGAAAAAQSASQPLDSDLTAIAALTTTSYGRALLALADAAAGRTAFGLGNVDNTSDANKPVSTAQATALALKGSASRRSGPFIFSGPSNYQDVIGRTNGTDTDGNSVVRRFADRTLIFPRLWYWNGGSWNNGQAGTGTVTISFGISLTLAGARTQATWRDGQATSRDVAVNGIVATDPIPLIIPEGSTYYVWCHWAAASGVSVHYNVTTALTSFSFGEGAESGTGTSDKTTGSGTIAQAFTFGVSACAVTDDAGLTLPLVVGFGDSITVGTGDSGAFGLAAAFRSGVVVGFLARAILADTVPGPFVNLGSGGDKLQNTAAASPSGLLGLRLYIASHASVNYSDLGINDVGASRTLSQMQADALTTWTRLAVGGARVIQSTITPNPTTSDSGITVANQTPHANDAARTGFNGWLRDLAPIDATTKAAVAVGTNSNVLRAGQTGHPLYWVDDLAATVESSLNSGKWAVPVTTTGNTHSTSTIDGLPTGHGFQVGMAIIGSGIGSTTIVASVSTNSITLDSATSSTLTGTALYGLLTRDMLHPQPYGHIVMAAAVDKTKWA